MCRPVVSDCACSSSVVGFFSDDLTGIGGFDFSVETLHLNIRKISLQRIPGVYMRCVPMLKQDVFTLHYPASYH